MKIYALPLAAILVLSSLTACSSMFGDNNRVVHVNSVPKDARVTVNNVALDSKTPTDIVITEMWSPTLIKIEKPGCSPTTQVIDPQFQKVGLWNILILPGFIVDAITGDMMKVPENQRNITAKLC